MAEKTKFTYQYALDLAHKTAEEEKKALPWYQEQALEYRLDLVDVLSAQVDSLKSALQFMRDFALCCDDRSIRDRRVKDMPWKDIYTTFFSILNLDQFDSEGKKWNLKTVKAACEMIHWTSAQDFFNALDVTSLKDKSSSKVHEFLEALHKSFIKHNYLRKAS